MGQFPHDKKGLEQLKMDQVSKKYLLLRLEKLVFKLVLEMIEINFVWLKIPTVHSILFSGICLLCSFILLH